MTLPIPSTSLSPEASWLGPIPTTPPSRSPCRVFVIAEAGGVDEGLRKVPLIGRSGQLIRDTLTTAGIPPSQTAYGNLFSWKPPYNNLNEFFISAKDRPPDYPSWAAPVDAGQYVNPHWLPELDRLRAEILTFRPNLVLCLGRASLWALTLAHPYIGRSRGMVFDSALIPGQKCLATWHTAHILREPKNRPLFISDIHKAAHESTFPEIRYPERAIFIPGTVSNVEAWIRTLLPPTDPPPYLSVDIETALKPTPQITCISIATSPFSAISIPFTAAPRPNLLRIGQSPHAWSEPDEYYIWALLGWLLGPTGPQIPLILQNGQYDAQWLWEKAGLTLRSWHDTMLMQHALFPELPKGLEALASVYTLSPEWKRMRPKGSQANKREE